MAHNFFTNLQWEISNILNDANRPDSTIGSIVYSCLGFLRPQICAASRLGIL